MKSVISIAYGWPGKQNASGLCRGHGQSELTEVRKHCSPRGSAVQTALFPGNQAQASEAAVLRISEESVNSISVSSNNKT